MTEDDYAEYLKVQAERKAIIMTGNNHTARHKLRHPVRAYKHWKEPHPHPQTGDMLEPGERVTWRIMGVYRRWTVFILLQLLTIVWWTHAGWFPGGLAGWNYIWSDLAIIVEMMVGIAFLNQSMRDARIIRQSLKDQEQLLAEVAKERAEVAEERKLLRRIHDMLEATQGETSGCNGDQDGAVESDNS